MDFSSCFFAATSASSAAVTALLASTTLAAAALAFELARRSSFCALNATDCARANADWAALLPGWG